MDKNEFKSQAEHVRAALKGVEADARALKAKVKLDPDIEPDPELAGEVSANVMLAIRHIEDARMRLGRGIQVLMAGL